MIYKKIIYDRKGKRKYISIATFFFHSYLIESFLIRDLNKILRYHSGIEHRNYHIEMKGRTLAEAEVIESINATVFIIFEGMTNNYFIVFHNYIL